MKESNALGNPNLIYIQSFHSVAKHGSLGAAVRADGGSIPTLSRHIAALEQAYKIMLFERRGDGLSLTESGAKLFEYAEAVRLAGQKFASAATGTADEIAGTIRISASRHFANFVLPEVMARLGTALPEISVELVVTDSTSNLLMREADIAVRLFRPEQSSLIAKQVGKISLGAYAAQTYIDRKGVPRSLEDLNGHDIIGDDSSEQVNRELLDMGIKITRDFFRYRCDDPSVAWRLVCAGCGIGLGYTIRASDNSTIQRVLEHVPEMSRPVWLTSHAELKTSAKVRAVFDYMSAELQGALI